MAVYRDDTPQKAVARKNLFSIFLLEMTKKGCEELQTTGLGFVLSSISVWAQEVMEEGAGPIMARYLRALADVVDTDKSLNSRKTAEQKRRKAFDDLSEFMDKKGRILYDDSKDPQP